MESGDTSNEEAAPSNPKRKTLMGNDWSKTVSDEVLSCGLPKGSAWHAAQFIDYGNEQRACLPWA